MNLHSPANLYETDFYAWTQHQAILLRKQQWNQLDLDHLTLGGGLGEAISPPSEPALGQRGILRQAQ
uniref:DUF29 domain-containing protein n=1 Tax=Desertifilum tharense IPPAS B-1220 TaxID=1781255 RepID=A0A1E5QIG0_9CYAN|nr:DUF29 family protein [Desertifilum tharense]OEJ74401.1 hypothetical protein BH720_14315 [Desertifilum tharense IPPAS B-1220]